MLEGKIGRLRLRRDPFAAQFLDSFRFMDQLGSLARQGVQTVVVNTLASSDYGLLDEQTLEPRPNYWAALVWKKTMGSRVRLARSSGFSR